MLRRDLFEWRRRDLPRQVACGARCFFRYACVLMGFTASDWTVCGVNAVERVTPTVSSDRMCQSTTAAPLVFDIDLLSSLSIPSSGAVGRVLFAFTARSNNPANRRLDVALSGLNATAFSVSTNFDAETGIYAISLTLTAGVERSAALEFTLSIRDARSTCYVAGTWQDGGCRYSRDFTLNIGRATCPANQVHVLSDGQLAVTASWADPIPAFLPFVTAGTPHAVSISSRTLGKGQHPVVLTWPNVDFSFGIFNVSCSFNVSCLLPKQRMASSFLHPLIVFSCRSMFLWAWSTALGPLVS
jgi:hypothetical protein